MIDPENPQRHEIKKIIAEVLERIDALAANFYFNCPTPTLTRETQVVLALFTSCIRLARASSWLIATDLCEEGYLPARSLIQDATTLAFISKHRDDWDRLAFGIYEKAAKSNLDSFRGDEPLVVESNAALHSLRTEYRKRGVERPRRLPSVHDMLKDLKLSYWYHFYQRASQMVHSTAGLATRVRTTPEAVTISMQGEIVEGVIVGYIAAEFLLTAIWSIAQLFDWVIEEDEVVSLWADTRERLNRLISVVDKRIPYPQ